MSVEIDYNAGPRSFIMSWIPRTIVTLCIFGLFLFLSMSAMAQTNCELKIEKENIKIYSCPTAESAFNSIKAEFEVSSTIDKYTAIVLDVNGYKDWRYREINHALLKAISDTELIYYTQIDAPFPVSNRDLVLHLKVSQDTITKIVTETTESMPDYLPAVDDVVRIPKSLSTMTLTPIDNSRLKVSCFIQVDPDGQIPAWVANLFGTQVPYETFKNLIEKMEAK